MTYTTIQGDTWDVIARKCYDSTAYTGKLIMANLKYAQFMFFPAGIVLNLPEVDTEEVAASVPWKEVQG